MTSDLEHRGSKIRGGWLRFLNERWLMIVLGRCADSIRRELFLEWALYAADSAPGFVSPEKKKKKKK